MTRTHASVVVHVPLVPARLQLSESGYWEDCVGPLTLPFAVVNLGEVPANQNTQWPSAVRNRLAPCFVDGLWRVPPGNGLLERETAPATSGEPKRPCPKGERRSLPIDGLDSRSSLE